VKNVFVVKAVRSMTTNQQTVLNVRQLERYFEVLRTFPTCLFSWSQPETADSLQTTRKNCAIQGKVGEVKKNRMSPAVSEMNRRLGRKERKSSVHQVLSTME
jgi:hypothetical protein